MQPRLDCTYVGHAKFQGSRATRKGLYRCAHGCESLPNDNRVSTRTILSWARWSAPVGFDPETLEGVLQTHSSDGLANPP